MTAKPVPDAFEHWLRVLPITGKMPGPLRSVMIPTFHCARFLRPTLESVLSQDPGPDVMQIEVVGDYSNNNNCFRSLSFASDHRSRLKRWMKSKLDTRVDR